ncbi:MAG: hypothetical protein U0163_20865, partial [Gemmatimonadaceae bacterium]
MCAHGAAYAVDSGSPYALFTDALAPVCITLDPSVLTIAARGLELDLAHILPFLTRTHAAESRSIATEWKSQTHWHFTHFLHRLAERSPLLLVLENMHHADTSSLDLLHVIGRHLGAARVAVVATYPDEEEASSPALQGVIRSMIRLPSVHRLHLLPLTQREVASLIRTTFKATGREVDDFAARIFAQTRGNPFYTEEVLRSMVESRALTKERGRWCGWNADAIRLTYTGREIVRDRLSSLSPDAARLSGILATVGTKVPLRTLQHIARVASLTLADPLDELLRRGLVVCTMHADSTMYDFAHPIVRSVVYDDLGPIRAQDNHALVFEALESLYGAGAEQHAAELAPHLMQAPDRLGAERSVRYFVAAGRDALQKRADQDADRLLSRALDLIDHDSAAHADALPVLLVSLSRARQRLGAHAAATALLIRARDLARARSASADEAAIERRLGLVSLGAGDLSTSLTHFQAAEERATAAGATALMIRSRIARATALQSLGDAESGRQLIRELLPVAESLGEPALIASVHRTMVHLYSWTGPASEARRHGEVALHNAALFGDKEVAWSVHWALCLMAGLAADAAGVREHQQEAERLANELRSPLRLAMSAELGIEYASATGDWGPGLELAERVLPIARALAP